MLPSERTPGPDHAAPEPYEVVGPNVIEPKTKAAGAGAGAGAILSTFFVWLADLLWWNGDADPAVPLPVAAVITLVVTSAVAFGASYYARHVNRIA